MEDALFTSSPRTSGSVFSLFSIDINSLSGHENDAGPSTTNENGDNSSDSHSCKICRDNSIAEEIISPCSCTGTMGRVHRKCLEEWLSTSNKNTCEICKYAFQVERTPRGFTDWLTNQQSRLERRYIIADLVCFLLLAPLTIGSTYLCGKGAYYYFDVGLVWLSAGLMLLSSFLWLLFIFWTFMTVRFHINVWHKWQRRNQVVRLVLNHNQENNAEFEDLRASQSVTIA